MSYYYYISITIDSIKFEIISYQPYFSNFGDFLNMPQPLSHISIYHSHKFAAGPRKATFE